MNCWKGTFVSVCNISIICLQYKVVLLENVLSILIHFSFISDNTQLKKCHHMCSGWSRIDDQPSILANKINILHVTRTQQWALSDWIAASVPPWRAKEFWAQALINGTCSLFWSTTLNKEKKKKHLTESCKIPQTDQRAALVQPDAIHFLQFLDNFRCIYSVDHCQHTSLFIFFKKYSKMTWRQHIL